MVQSLNTKADYTVKATSYLGLTTYGNIMIGDKAFEFYNQRNVKDYIQIPWEEVDYVIASVMFKGKWIPRFAIQTKESGTYSFSSRNNRELLRAIGKYVEPDHMRKSLTFLQVLRRGICHLLKKIFKKQART